MKLLNKTRLQSSSSRSGALRPDGAPPDDAPVHAGDDEAQNTEKWAVPDEIVEEPAKAGSATVRAARHMSTTVASRIPAMLAESMGLAEEENPGGQSARGTKVIPTNRR